MSKTYEGFRKADQSERSGRTPPAEAPPPRKGAKPQASTRPMKRLCVAMLAIVAVAAAVAVMLPPHLARRVAEAPERAQRPVLPVEPDTARRDVIEVTPPTPEYPFDPEDTVVTTVEVVGLDPEAEWTHAPGAPTPQFSEAVAVPDRLTAVRVPDGEPVDMDRSVGPASREGVTDFGRGVNLQAAGQYDEAIEHYHNAIARNPSHAGAHNNLGIIHQSRGEYARAAEMYRKAIAADPSDYRSYSNLAACEIELRRYEQAVAALRRSLELNPDNYSALCNLGVAHTGMGNLDLAESILRRAVEAYPTRLRAIYNLANVYRHKNQRQEAARYYRLFLEQSEGRYPAQERVARGILATLVEGGEL